MTTINHSIFTGSAGADENTLIGRGFARVVDGREYGYGHIPNTRRVLEHPEIQRRKWAGIVAMLTSAAAVYLVALIDVGVR